MSKALLAKIKESVISVLPVAAIVLAMSFTPLVEFTLSETLSFAFSAIALVIGMALFNLGADLAMTPMGSHIGEGLTKSKRVFVLVSVCLVMGILITVAEPDLSVLAEQVGAAINGTVLTVSVGVGVGLFLVLAIVKIVLKKDLTPILLFSYLLLFALAALLADSGKSEFMPMSFDSGGVTTGPITVPFIMALGVGISLTVGGKDAKENSFGLIALCSIGPIIAVLVLSLASDGGILPPAAEYSADVSFPSVGELLLETVKDVGFSLALVVFFFFLLQFLVLKLPKNKIIQILIGIAFTFVGLVIFLTAVSVGFMPIGYKLGHELAGSSELALIVFAFVLGAVVVLAEPAVHVLNKQVEGITSGAVTKSQMTIAMSLGVGISIGLSVIRIVFGFSVLYYLIPGYLISLGLSFFVPKLYTAIAFDSGGVASGPLTSSFILPMAIGACVALHGRSEILDLAFGIVAMVAMTPLITIQTLGFRAIVAKKSRDMIAMRRIISADDEQIIYF